MLREIKCRYCDAKFSVQGSANFSVICSYCNRLIKLECEYGFGPVTPCRIYLGEQLIGVVDCVNHNYYLREHTKLLRLNKSYLEAIHEALNIISSRLPQQQAIQIHAKQAYATSDPLELFSNKEYIQITTKSGSLRLFGEWMSKPYDRPLKIQHASYDGEILEIIFKRENLLIYNPKGIISTEQELRIEKANKIKWIYLPDGDIRETSVDTITYILEDGKLTKNSKYGTEQQTLKESVDAVYLGDWQWDE